MTILLFFVALAGTSGATEDITEMLQSSKQAMDVDACSCLSWQSIYANHSIECGNQGQELVFAGNAAFLKNEFCTHWYERIHSNYCTQHMFGKQDATQWCYVSSSCEELNGGAKIEGKDVSWKKCAKERDPMLGSLSPAELYKWAQEEDMDAGLALKMAYPVWLEGNLKYPNIKPFFGVRRTAFEAFTHSFDKKAKKFHDKLAELRRSGEPMIFDSKSGHPPFAVVLGSQVTEAHFSAWAKQMFVKGKDPFEHPGQMNEFECVAGCDK